MAQWDDILRATLKAAGKAADEIEEIIAKVGKAVDGGTPKVAAEAAETTKTVSAAELAKMSKAERSAYNASKSAEDRIVAAATGSSKRAERKLANIKEGEDVINATLGESAKTQLGEKGIAQQFDQYFKKSELAEPSKVLKRTMNDPDYVALQKAEDTAVAKAEKEVMDAIESAKADGKPMTEDQIRTLISSKAKAISDEVADSFKSKSQTDIETIKGRAAEGGRELSKKEKAAIAKREEVSYRSAKERADDIETQSRSVAEGGNSAIRTRVKTLNELTPEEQRMSGVKAALYKEKAVAQSKGEIAFVTRLEKLAADKKLIPVLDKEGQQIMEEIIVDGEKMTVPRYETPAERNLRLQKDKPFKAKDLSEPSGKPGAEPKTPEELLNIKNSKDSVVTESSAKLRAQQEANVIRGAREAAEKSGSPAAKEAFAKITKEYERGAKTKEEYLAYLKGIPKITGEALTPEEIAKLDKGNAASIAAKKQRELDSIAELEKKYGKGYTTEPGESGTTVYKPAEVPKSELKGRKWIRDARGNLVLAKK